MNSERLAGRMATEGWKSSTVVMWDRLAEVILLRVVLKDGTIAWDVSSPWRYTVIDDVSNENESRQAFHQECLKALQNQATVGGS